MQSEYEFYHDISEYCEKYNIPIENLLDILEDQKVLPMMRGKASEFIATAVLKKILNKREWQVQKLNLNPQHGHSDEDISITHSRKGTRLNVEVKSSVRESFKIGTPRTIINSPHFKVKCHRSRSNTKKKTNDRYLVDDFDLIITNVSNAIFQGNTSSAGMLILRDRVKIDSLKEFYRVNDDASLIRCAYDDWRCVLPSAISLEDGTIPRTPSVCLDGDPHWFKIEKLGARLDDLIQNTP